MKIKLLVAVVFAAVLSVAPWSLYAEEPQPTPAAVDSGAGRRCQSLRRRHEGDQRKPLV